MCPAPWTDSPPPLLMEDDYTTAPRPHPLSHPPVDAPLCPTCTNLDLSFFDPSCPGCNAILKSRETRQEKIKRYVEIQKYEKEREKFERIKYKRKGAS